jgi:transcriptional regulator with XRE-family HTH domain
MMLAEWRKSKGWSQAHLANSLSKKLDRLVTQSNVASWENGGMPGADVGEIIRKMSRGKVLFSASKP